jgi:uncharacterized protein (TIGR02996 family)
MATKSWQAHYTPAVRGRNQATVSGPEMNQGQAFLQSAWVSGDDAGILLVFADWLEEQGDPAAEVIRLVAAEAGTARHSKERVTASWCVARCHRRRSSSSRIAGIATGRPASI